MDDKPDVAGLTERLRAMVSRDGRALVCNGRTTKVMCDDITEAATALEALSAENARLKEALLFIATGGFKGDKCRQIARETLALTGSQSHD